MGRLVHTPAPQPDSSEPLTSEVLREAFGSRLVCKNGNVKCAGSPIHLLLTTDSKNYLFKLIHPHPGAGAQPVAVEALLSERVTASGPLAHA